MRAAITSNVKSVGREVLFAVNNVTKGKYHAMHAAPVECNAVVARDMDLFACVGNLPQKSERREAAMFEYLRNGK